MAGVRDNTVTNVSTGSIASFKSVGNVPLKSLKVNFNPIQEGEGDPSPSNVRPISGWTGINAVITGSKNICPPISEWVSGYLASNGVISAADATRKEMTSPFIPIKGTVKYAFSYMLNDAIPSSEQYWAAVCMYDNEKNFIQRNSSHTNTIESFTNTQYNNVAYIRCSFRTFGIAQYVQVENGNTPTSYEPYQGSIIPVSWSELGTVYGGYVDPVTGEIWETWRYIDLGDIDWSVGSTTYGSFYQARLNADAYVNSTTLPKMFCDSMEVVSLSKFNTVSHQEGEYWIDFNSSNTCYIMSRDFIGKTTQQVKNFVKGMHMAYHLAMPVLIGTIDQIQIKTLRGVNNIWSNGDTVEAEYYFLESLDVYKQRFKANEPYLQTATGNVANFTTDMVAPLKECKINFLPIQASGTPSPDNVLPITGWTECDLWKTGKNIVHQVGWSTSNVSSSTGQRYTSNSYGTTINTTDPTNSITVTQTQAQTDPKNSFRNGYVVYIDDNLVFGEYYRVSLRVTNIVSNPLNASLSNITFCSPSGGQAVPTVVGDRIYTTIHYSQNPSIPGRRGFEIRICGMSCTFSDFMVTPVDDTDITYEPYNGSTTSITLPSTYYGGYIDLTTGKLVQTYKYIHLAGNEDWLMSTSTLPDAPFRPSISVESERTYIYKPGISDKVGPTTDWQPPLYKCVINNMGRLLIGLPAEMDTKEKVNNWIQSVGGIDVCWETVFPIEYSLTPTQIKTLKGLNNIWSNTNSTTEVKYWTHGSLANRKKVIWNQTAKPINSDNWAPYDTSMISTSFNDGIATSTWLQQNRAFRTSIYSKTGKNQTSGDIIYGSYELNPSVNTLYWGADIGYITCYGQELLPSNTWSRVSFRVTCGRTSFNRMYISYCNASDNSLVPIGMTCQVRNPIQVNLTQMFGAGNQPTKEEFEALCAKNGIDLTQYHPYDEGTEMYWYF